MSRSLIIFGKGGFAREILFHSFCSSLVSYSPLISMDDSDIDDPTNEKLIKLYQFIFGFSDPNGKMRAYEKYKDKIIFGDYLSLSLHLPMSKNMTDKIGRGSIICPGAIITVDVQVGIGVTINMNCTIGHDTTIGDFSTLHPGVNISGNVRIGKRVLLGTNACVKDKVSICDDAMIGIGSVVVNDITTPGTYFGNPCRKVSQCQLSH